MFEFNEVKALLSSSKAGDEVEVFCEGRHVRALKEEIPGLTWRQVTMGHFIFIVPEPPMKSGKTLVFEMLEKYDGGFLKLEMTENSARVYVSQFNKANDTKFKVTMKEGVPHVYADVSDRKYIRFSEYANARDKAIEELNRLRAMVRPDSHFEMLSPDFDNGIPPVTASNLEPSIQDDDAKWGDIPKRGFVYVCDDCGDVVPEEQGEVDVCASCMSLREANQPSNNIEGSALPMEQHFEDDEIEDDIVPIQAKECEECREEFPTDDPFQRKCDICRL